MDSRDCQISFMGPVFYDHINFINIWQYNNNLYIEMSKTNNAPNGTTDLFALFLKVDPLTRMLTYTSQIKSLVNFFARFDQNIKMNKFYASMVRAFIYMNYKDKLVNFRHFAIESHSYYKTQVNNKYYLTNNNFRIAFAELENEELLDMFNDAESNVLCFEDFQAQNHEEREENQIEIKEYFKKSFLELQNKVKPYITLDKDRINMIYFTRK